MEDDFEAVVVAWAFVLIGFLVLSPLSEKIKFDLNETEEAIEEAQKSRKPKQIGPKPKMKEGCELVIKFFSYGEILSELNCE